MKEFLERLLAGFADAVAFLVLWTKAGTSAFSATELEGAIQYAEAKSAATDIYFSPGLQSVRPEGRGRGEARTVAGISTLWLDIDVAGGAHKKDAEELPSREQALAMLDEAPLKPSVIVETGGGFHAYWILEQPWWFAKEEDRNAAQELLRSFQRYFINQGKKNGFHVDNTSALNQLLRVPGTLNHKYAPPFPVAVLDQDASRRYSIASFAESFPSMGLEKVAQVHERPNTPSAVTEEAERFEPVDLELIEKHCLFMAYCRDDAALLTEPFWFAQASIIARCTDGIRLFHARSEPHGSYKYNEAEAKFENAAKYGPRTCDSIRHDLGFRQCEQCACVGKVRSPISLGWSDALSQARICIFEMLHKAANDPGAPFEEESIQAMLVVKKHNLPLFMKLRSALKELGVPLKKLDDALSTAMKSSRAGAMYRVDNNCIVMTKMTNAGEVDVPLANFSAEIVEEVTRDDGAEKNKRFCVQGVLATGELLPPVDIQVQQFGGLNWVLDEWGSRPTIFAGCREHLRTGIQILSRNVTRRDLFTHTGWRQNQDEWVFLSGSGALGHGGWIEGVEVDLGEGGLRDYQLELPPPEQVPFAIASAMKLLEVGTDLITAPLLAAVFLAPLAEILKVDFSLFLSGLTGTRKSELAALCAGFFGKGFHGKNLPANWSSTDNSLEKLCFLAKDVIMVIDDFNPIGSMTDVNHYHKKADRVLRGQGNQSGRQRMRSGGSLRPTYRPRGLIIGTGEDIPRGQSLRARIFILEVDPTSVNCARLTELQTLRDSGALASCMSAYTQWLAPRIEELAKTLPDRKKALREDALVAGTAHSRTPDAIAGLLIGIEMFTQFALDTGAISQEEAAALWARVQGAIFEAASRQGVIQEEEDPCQRFLDLLASCLSAGALHLEDVKGGAPQVSPEAFGWKEFVSGTGATQVRDYRAQGRLTGWVKANDIFLDPDVAFAAVQSMAAQQGNSISIGMKTLHKRMAAKGLIVSSDQGVHTKRMSLGGVRRRVLHIAAASVVVQSPPQVSPVSSGGHPPGAAFGSIS